MNNDEKKLIKYVVNSVLTVIFCIVIITCVVNLFRSEIEIKASCSSGEINLDIVNSDLDNINLSKIDDMNCEFYVKGNSFNLGGILPIE